MKKLEPSRKEKEDALCKSMLHVALNDTEYLESLIYSGFKGYKYMTLGELDAEYYDYIANK